jgi:hypothetical protein
MKKVIFFQIVSVSLFGPQPNFEKIIIDVIASGSFSQSMFLPVDVVG